MLQYIKEESNKTFTENGAVTYQSTNSDCLDLFSTIGALRRENDGEIINRFIRAYSENADLAMKMLFYARDVRGGLGERRVFRVILNWLSWYKPESVKKNLENIAEYGRFDDLLSLFGTPCEKEMISLVKKQFDADIDAMKNGKAVSLLAKWLPSVNASNVKNNMLGKMIAKKLGYTQAEYRKVLSQLRKNIKIIENNLREKDYTFDYSKQPSRAMFKYQSAFIRNDSERYDAFINAVSAGKATLHADNVAPYELVEPYLGYGWYYECQSFMKIISEAEKKALNATWDSIPDFGGNENTLAVIDTSGSMYGGAKPLPAAVAISLGMYFAQHNKGAFKNHFIEFSASPQLIEIKGETFADKLSYVASFSKVANTNLEAVFGLILNAAIKNKLPQSELPSKLVIISDMEFDACVDNATTTNFNNAKKKFKSNGYNLPQIVFWNVASRNRQQPVTQNEQGVALVSGVTPRIFGMIAGDILSPYLFMMEVLSDERYAKIVA